MAIRVSVYVLSALAALVIVLTRLRLRRDEAAGRSKIPAWVVNVHTAFGALGLAGWVVYLVVGEDTKIGIDRDLLGILALGLLWVTALVGLLILLRWLPTRGRHASASTEDTWSTGPGLSILAHVGLACGVAVFTVAYMLQQV